MMASKPTYALKLEIVAAKVPSAAAATAVEESMVPAMLALPQGLAADGRWTSLRTGVPFTPSAGAIAAWAWTWAERARTRRDAMKDLENMLDSKMTIFETG